MGGISCHYWKTSSGKFGRQDWKEGLRGVRENTAGSGDNRLLPRETLPSSRSNPKLSLGYFSSNETVTAAIPVLFPTLPADPGDPCPCQEGIGLLQPTGPAQAPFPGPADTPFIMWTRGCAGKKTSFPGSLLKNRYWFFLIFVGLTNWPPPTGRVMP